MKKIILLICIGAGIVSFNSSCVKEKVVHVVHDKESNNSDVKPGEKTNPVSEPESIQESMVNYENEVAGVCQYCNGTGENYRGQMTPLAERDLINLDQYTCKVCGGKGVVKPSEAEKIVKFLQEKFGPNWYLQ